MIYLSPNAAWELSHGRRCTYEAELCIGNKVVTTQMSPSESGGAILDFIRLYWIFSGRLHSLEDKSLCWKVINDFVSRLFNGCCAVLANLGF